jgi:hypothetical protein
LFDVLGEGFEGGADESSSAQHIARRDGEAVAGFEEHRLMILEQRGADFGSLQVGEDAERLVFLAAHLANLLDDRDLAFVRAMGEIQADDIDAGANHGANDSLGVGSRPKRGDNLGAALRRGFRQIEVGKRHGGGSKFSFDLAKGNSERVKVSKGTRLILL